MSHTFDINPLSAVHRKLAADETVNRAILCYASERMESATLLYCRCDAISSLRAATSLGRDRLVCVVAHIFSPEGSTGISTEATGNDHGLTART